MRKIGQKGMDFLLFPLRILLKHETNRKLGLTSLQDERFNICMQYANGKILDIGCGKGNHFSKKVADAIGLDPYPWEGVDIVGLAEKLPFADRSFQTVTMMASFRYVKERGKALHEINRVLQENGTILIQENSPWLNRLRHFLISWNPYAGMEDVVGLNRVEMENLIKVNNFRLKKIVRYVYGLSQMYVVEKKNSDISME
jgi:ubiquinone/menaquinone biosynthesis C-methylase UbiE